MALEVVAGYVVVRSLINHPVLLAAGFRWANFDFRSGIRLSCAFYMYIIYCILESVGVGRSMRRCCSRRPVQMTTTGTLCEKRQCYLPLGDQERWRRRPLIVNLHTHTHACRECFLYSDEMEKKRVHAWVAENLIWNSHTLNIGTLRKSRWKFS